MCGVMAANGRKIGRFWKATYFFAVQPTIFLIGRGLGDNYCIVSHQHPQPDWLAASEGEAGEGEYLRCAVAVLNQFLKRILVCRVFEHRDHGACCSQNNA